MLGLHLELLKKQTSKIIESSITVLAEKSEKAKDVCTEIAEEIQEVSKQIIKETETIVTNNNVGNNVASKIESLFNARNNWKIKNVITKNNMEKKELKIDHKILMMGGRRSGKSSILSSILYQLSSTPGRIFTISDITDYTEQIETKDGLIDKPTLDIKRREIISYIENRCKNTEFMVDMSPTYGKASYILEFTSGEDSLNFEFIDVPGEWMRSNVPEHAKLKALINECDVFVIAIDTPFLMNANDNKGIDINQKYNRIEEIVSAMASSVNITSSLDLKQIILCPIKCEKWVRNGEANEVVAKIRQEYRKLINRFVSKSEVTIQIMPIQTVGGFEHTRMLPALEYFKDESIEIGVLCSEDPLTGILNTKEGKVIRRVPNDDIQSNKEFTVDYTDIPLSWYTLNDNEFSPKYCEQPGYHILKFLVEKEENIIKEKALVEKRKLQRSNSFYKWFMECFKPTFGTYLPKWQSVIRDLNSQHLIKTDGDGFCYVNKSIE